MRTAISALSISAFSLFSSAAHAAVIQSLEESLTFGGYIFDINYFDEFGNYAFHDVVIDQAAPGTITFDLTSFNQSGPAIFSLGYGTGDSAEISNRSTPQNMEVFFEWQTDSSGLNQGFVGATLGELETGIDISDLLIGGASTLSMTFDVVSLEYGNKIVTYSAPTIDVAPVSLPASALTLAFAIASLSVLRKTRIG